MNSNFSNGNNSEDFEKINKRLDAMEQKLEKSNKILRRIWTIIAIPIVIYLLFLVIGFIQFNS